MQKTNIKSALKAPASETFQNYIFVEKSTATPPDVSPIGNGLPLNKPSYRHNPILNTLADRHNTNKPDPNLTSLYKIYLQESLNTAMFQRKLITSLWN